MEKRKHSQTIKISGTVSPTRPVLQEMLKEVLQAEREKQ
jgi:hypothetical protein